MRNICVFTPNKFADENWLPALWCQAKTYYERHGKQCQHWNWVPCYADAMGTDSNSIKNFLKQNPPDVFAISLYVWNYSIALDIATWVKQTWPHCIIISGGPHQYFKHSADWFLKHTFIDASLPGECFGELCLLEVLDNLDFHGNIDWHQVTDVCFPMPRSRAINHSKKRSDVRSRSQFDYQWSAFAEQKESVLSYIDFCKKKNPQAKILAILETTRGCPYGCTYCDWGGGINTKVVAKALDVVKRDLDFLCDLNLKFLYIADANFGIFGQRDIDIVKHIVELSGRYKKHVNLGYGGFAKTENKLEAIREIMKLDLENQLSLYPDIKISMQSLDPEILKNIDRKNIKLEKQLEVLSALNKKRKLPLYVELILGLPGQTLDKFYHELSELGQRDLSCIWYEWLLLPETPAYDPAYRNKFGLSTVYKTAGWAVPQIGSGHEIVIESNSYSSDDYLEMLLATGVYNLLGRGGVFKQSQQWIQQHHGVNVGQLTHVLIKQLTVPSKVRQQWNLVIHNPDQPCVIEFDCNSVYLGYYWPAAMFWHGDIVIDQFVDILEKTFGVPKKLLSSDARQILSHDRLGKKWVGLKRLNFGQDSQKTWQKIMTNFYNFNNSGHVMLAHSDWLPNQL